MSERTRAVLEALFVTLLWSSSWVLIRFGLDRGLPALSFAGVRYLLAAAALLTVVLAHPTTRRELAGLGRRAWGLLAALGLVYYAGAQGAQFLGIALLPAATLSLLLNLTPAVVAGWAVASGGERPTPQQVVGLALATTGVAVYFVPFAGASLVGLAVGVVALLANAGGSVLGRSVARAGLASPVVVTTASMVLGAVALLGAGVATNGWPTLDPRSWAIVVWLAVVNTAVAFTLWNRALRHLTAVEASVINGTMLPQIALLGWLVLDEPLGPRALVGLALVGLGTLVVQLRR
jgi:drug/metabolite transporter (DMT)-like permease